MTTISHKRPFRGSRYSVRLTPTCGHWRLETAPEVARLDELGLDPSMRAKIEASIAARLALVTDESQAQFAAEAARVRREIHADMAEYRYPASRRSLRVSASRAAHR